MIAIVQVLLLAGLMILQAGLELLRQHIIVEIRQQLHAAIRRQVAAVHLQVPLILRVVHPPAPVILRAVHLHHPLGRVVILVVAEVVPVPPVRLVEAAGEDNRVGCIKKIYV